jgi:hypothetical protein
MRDAFRIFEVSNRKENRHLTPAADWLNVVIPLGVGYCVPEIVRAFTPEVQQQIAAFAED